MAPPAGPPAPDSDSDSDGGMPQPPIDPEDMVATTTSGDPQDFTYETFTNSLLQSEYYVTHLHAGKGIPDGVSPAVKGCWDCDCLTPEVSSRLNWLRTSAFEFVLIGTRKFYWN